MTQENVNAGLIRGAIELNINTMNNIAYVNDISHEDMERYMGGEYDKKVEEKLLEYLYHVIGTMQDWLATYKGNIKYGM